MKKLIFGLLAFSISSILTAQVTANAYMDRTPTAPPNICKITGVQKDAFIKTVKELSEVIQQDADNRKKEASDYAEAQQAEMEAGAMRNSGMSEQDIKKMQNGKELTEAEQKEIADKMIRQKANMTLDEAKNLGKLSKEGQQAWAQGYAAEQMAMAQGGNGQAQGGNQAGMKTYELLSEQSSLQSAVNVAENRLSQQYRLLDQEAEAEKATMENELKPFREELGKINDGEGSTQADIDHARRVMAKIHARQDQYCEKYTSRLLDFLEQYKMMTKSSIPDYDRLEELQFQVTAAQTVTKPATAGKGLYSIQAVDRYLGYLVEVFRYKLYQADN